MIVANILNKLIRRHMQISCLTFRSDADMFPTKAPSLFTTPRPLTCFSMIVWKASSARQLSSTVSTFLCHKSARYEDFLDLYPNIIWASGMEERFPISFAIPCLCKKRRTWNWLRIVSILSSSAMTESLWTSLSERVSMTVCKLTP